MAGSVWVTLQIGPGGKILSAWPSGGVGLSTDVVWCVARVAAAAAFSPPEGGQATLVIPLTFAVVPSPS
jgi:hypothetical protein